ncbi:putative membrane-anchored protein [Caldalkalibacillus uzonensis]|uniref:Membrane-anchored protein n=1 Tax=Caldalkalibacillus uzonensis TaxID=353224 RepID=A0ABU0CNQ4_9BACI|nr:putative cytokinetic ring protein SteA [Caldalkalibacillus uzonensis]MDQ0337713.1 putative membrane-anchored protein [Caldalkalibacillus uzonensis]
MDNNVASQGYGPVYFHNRTKQLVRWIPEGAYALIEHKDIDEMAALALIDKNVKGVLNYAPSMSGDYPSLGTIRLIEHGVPVYDIDDPQRVKQVLRQGHTIHIDGRQLWLKEPQGPSFLSSLTRYTDRDILLKLKLAQANLKDRLQKFVENTLTYALQELPEILQPVPIPKLKLNMRDRHVVVVTRGSGYMEDLMAIKDYIAEVQPVLIGVDGGADAILECGLKPHLIFGDMDSISHTALCSGAEIVVHAYKTGQAPGLNVVHRLGISAHIFPCFGTSEDAAHLLADEAGARLIVSVGSHTHMLDFLEKGRQGMASTLLVRMKLGGKLVDAKGIHHLCLRKPHSRISSPLSVSDACLEHHTH